MMMIEQKKKKKNSVLRSNILLAKWTSQKKYPASSQKAYKTINDQLLVKPATKEHDYKSQIELLLV